MAIKRYVEGQGWVEIANNSSSSGKALNISITDSGKYFDSGTVEGALAETGADIKNIKSDVNRLNDLIRNHTTNHPSGGGGGPSGPGTGAILPTISSTYEVTGNDGKTPIEIPIFFSSPSLGDGTAYILVKNIEVATQIVQQGNNTIIVPPVGAGKNIPIAIYVKDRAGLISNQLTWTVTAGGIEITMRTNLSTDFSLKSRIALAYTITCVSTEEINTHFVFKGYDYTNGVEVDKEVVYKSINGYNSYAITDMGVGVYKLEYWAESGGFITNKYKASLVIVDENMLLVSTDFDPDAEYESGIPISVPYRISIDKDEDFNVELYIDGAINKKIVTRPSYLYWSIPSLDPGDHILKIKAYNEELGLEGETEFLCKVIQGEYARIQPVVDASLMCWFDATDKTNDDSERDIWIDKIGGNVGRLYNFNYGSNGWIKPEGSNYSELTIDGTCYVEIDMTPFKDNFKDGATIELVFRARDVGNDAARILDITDVNAPYKGVYVDTREAYLATASQTINASVGEEEWIHVMYQMDRDNKYAHIIINGVITKSGKLRDTGSGTSAILENIDHAQKIYLNGRKGQDLFGKCEVKHLRIYDRCLSFDEILQNYLSTIEDLTLQKNKADFNDPLKNIMPSMEITCDPAVFETMTDTNKVEVSMTYRSPNSDLYGETLTDATRCLMYWQGTSSVSYNVKNYNIVLRDSNGQEIMYSPYPECIPQSLFCLKANLMESTNAHNVGLADFVRRYLYTSKNPAQLADPKASRTIQGFPILLYINGQPQGLYDFNLDRYSTTAFGYDLPAHKGKCKVYEISANTNFTAGAFIPWSLDSGVDEWTWYKNDFAGIYPAEIVNPMNDDYAELKELINFVYNSNDEVFRTNFSIYFDKESVLRYYILVMVLGLVDSLGKNAKLVTYDGIKWYFEFYDMDTALGLNNTGLLKYDVDIEMVVEHFNTAESTLWKRVNELFHADIINEYATMRNTTLTLDNIYECLFTNQIEKIPESEYNNSTQNKYLKDGTYLSMSHGNRYYNLKRWLKERLIFCDSLFNYSPTLNVYAQIRSGFLGEVTIDLETYYPMYVTVRWRNQEDGSADEIKKIGRNQKVRFSGTILSSDQEVFIYCSPHIKTISGLENFYPQQLLLNNMTKITSLECPNSKALANLEISNCTYLQRIDISGCSQLGSIQESQKLEIGNCTNLRYLNAYGTSLTSITFPASGGNLVELYIPRSLQELELRNQYGLRIVGIPGASSLDTSKMIDIKNNASNLASLSLINCPLIERLTYNENFAVSGLFFDHYANERSGNEIDMVNYKYGSWRKLMGMSTGFANCTSVYIENSCHPMEAMCFRNMDKLVNLTLRDLPNLKALIIGANCCGYRTADYVNQDIYSQFDWSGSEETLTIRNCNNIEEFRIHEMYPYNYTEGRTNNLTYFNFKDGTGSLVLSEKFPNLKVFECNMITQNISQIVLPKDLKSIITCAWHQKIGTEAKSGFSNEAKIEKYNISSIFFEGEHEGYFDGIDLGNHEMEDVRITAPYASKIIGLNTKNNYVNPVFNEFKEPGLVDRYPITPNGSIDVSEFKWKAVSDWFAFTDFTNTTCDIKTPENWDAFINGITKADRMFYYCKNPDFTWEFAMKFFPKINTLTGFGTMYQNAVLAEQTDFDTDGVEMINSAYNLGGYLNGVYPFKGSNLKFVKTLRLDKSESSHYTFAQCTSLERIGDCIYNGTSESTSPMGISGLFSGCTSLQQVGNIQSTAKNGGKRSIPTARVFEGCTSLQQVGEINVASSTTVSMYEGCANILSAGVSLPDMTQVKEASSMFRLCSALLEFTLGDLNNLIKADYLFRDCAKLKKVYLPTVGPDSKIQEFQNAFYGCAALEEVVLGGVTLPKEIKNLSRMFEKCSTINKLPALPTTMNYNEVDMSFCCSECTSLQDANMYKFIPVNVYKINNMYQSCTSLINPEIEIRSDKSDMKQMFKGCSGMLTLSVNCTGGTLDNTVKFAEDCVSLTDVEFTFPNSLKKDSYYDTGCTFYNMFIGCVNLTNVVFDMSKIRRTNTKADFGAMFVGDKSIRSIKGLDLSCLKKPIHKLESNKGGGSYDNHNTSITYGTTYDYLNDFKVVPDGLLSSSYNFEDIVGVDHIKEILSHLDTVTNETIGLTYNIGDILNNPDMEGVDPELLRLAIEASEKGWTFALV